MIRILPDAVVNRIAAGEVIERPAAAVKELVENALDAGASRIAVALDGGGIERIEVSDDGAGIGAEDLALAVRRHATSKLADGDLTRIATLGFRGEALAAIGAAARLEITSRPPGGTAAAITVEAGRVGTVHPAAGPPGTRVVVRDLFFATPARRKFLRQPRTEAEHAEAMLRRLALAAPMVAFRLEIDGRAVFDLPAQDRAARVAALLGAEAAAALVPVEAARDGLSLAGFAGSPALSRATAAHLVFTVNNRPIAADPLLRGAVRAAYAGVIEAGRHPVAALWLDVPPDSVDVNVHPTKAELRFRDPGAVRALLVGGIGRALAGAAGVAVPAARPALGLAPPRPPSGWRMPLPGLAEAQQALEMPVSVRAAPPPAPQRQPLPLGVPVAQILDTYVVAVAGDGGLVLVDQHAAHERLTHETLRSQLLDGGVRSQPLLMPAVVELPPADAARLVAFADMLARLGLEIEAFGPGAVLVRALPAALGAPDPAPLLRDLADELAEWGAPAALEARLDAAIARLACHGSVRAGRRLAPEEMDALLRQMEATPRAATCSHGRPTVLKFSREDLAALFRRG
ncbi:MAG TPA: DNA mismatch repair endonuclease MutL [Acetobacteraceae bacterium]|nr:DNA mismatch repair endonuclease MutL [Acetobacteraceae bacterium]